MRSSIGRDDDAAGENYLVIDNVITGEAITGGEIGYSTCSSDQYQVSRRGPLSGVSTFDVSPALTSSQ